MFLALIAILLTLILVVGLHESGHALVARIFQVKVKKISIGFGKPLLRWQSQSGCEWVWSLFPLGGYVQLENTRISPVSPENYSSCFDKKPITQRILILLAGSVANLMVTWFAFMLVFILGFNYVVPQIQTVVPNSAATRVGMLPGDRFISIGGEATPTWREVGMQLISGWGKKEIPVTLIRSDGHVSRLSLDLSQISFHGAKFSLLTSLGIKPNLSAAKSRLVAHSFLDALHQTNKIIREMVYFFFVSLKQLFSGVIPFSMLLGPLGIFVLSVSSLIQGVAVFMFFVASLSLSVAVMNLFPIPGLDGGSIVYAIIEKIRGKPVSIALELLIHRVVFIVFCVLLIHLLMNDLQRF